jgi:hypothetical protein
MAVQTESIVRPRHELSVGHIEAIYTQAQDQLVNEFYRAQGDPNVPTIVRNLLPSDLNESNNIWAETVTATGSAYQDSQVAGQNIPDDTAIVMFGLIDTSDPQAVTQLRISSGQGVRAIWDLFPIIGSDPNLSGGVECRTMYAMTPIIITQNMNIKIEYYVRPSSPQVIRGAEIAILGLVAEKVGKNIQP